MLLTGDAQLAQDLTQVTLMKTFVNWRRIQDPNAVEAYARTTMVRAFTSSRRRRWKIERAVSTVSDLPVAAPYIADHAAEIVERDWMRQALRSLPRRQRAVLVLRFFNDLSVEETAAALNCSSGTVKSQTSRGLTRLRDRLPQHERHLNRTEAW